MISRSTDWDQFISRIVEHLGADPTQVIPGSAVLESHGGDPYVIFTCSFLITDTELTKIQQHTEGDRMNTMESFYNQFFKRWRNRDSQKTDLRYASTQEVANLLIIVSDIRAIVLAELDRRPVTTTKETA